MHLRVPTSMEPQRERTIVGRYLKLHPRTRIMLGCLGMVLSGMGLFYSDPERQAEHERRKQMAPRIATKVI